MDKWCLLRGHNLVAVCELWAAARQQQCLFKKCHVLLPCSPRFLTHLGPHAATDTCVFLCCARALWEQVHDLPPLDYLNEELLDLDPDLVLQEGPDGAAMPLEVMLGFFGKWEKLADEWGSSWRQLLQVRQLLCKTLVELPCKTRCCSGMSRLNASVGPCHARVCAACWLHKPCGPS